MANVNAPRGFGITDAAFGSILGAESFLVDASNATAIFQGDPVTCEADGAFKPSGAADLGAVAGIAISFGQYSATSTLANGKPLLYLPALTAGSGQYIPALQGVVFEIQANGVLEATSVGSTADFATGAGNTTTGVSAYTLDVATIESTGTQMRILGKVDDPNNNWGAYVRVRVVFVKSMYQNSTSI